MNWRRLFYLPRSDRRVLLFIMLCAITVIVVYKCLYPESATSVDFTDADSRLQDTLRRELASGMHKGEVVEYDGTTVAEPETFPFDPNQADSMTFVRLGLRPWQASNALKYRRKGGRWRSADDFSRLYGLSEKDFRRLRPYIRISEEDVRPIRTDFGRDRVDTFRRRYPEKFARGVTVDLNQADTNVLKRVPGIGSYYSRAIRRYGDRLGGYVSVGQLKEIEGLPEDIETWFTVNSSVSIHRLSINKATFKQLIRHPYLNYEQVKSIFDYRRKYGDIKGWRQLQFYPAFTDEDFRRLTPYIAFD